MSNEAIIRRACKRRAKGTLSGIMGKALGVTLITMGISFLGSMAIGLLVPQAAVTIDAAVGEVLINWQAFFTMMAFELILSILIFPITMGSYAFYMTASKTQPVTIMDIFVWFGERGRIGTAIKAFLWQLLLSIGWGTLFLVLPVGATFALDLFFSNLSDVAYVTVSVVLLIAVLVCSVLAQVRVLSYMPALFMLADAPDRGVRETFAECTKRMHGHRWGFFVLYLSFIPWFLTAFFSCGLSLLYVAPYLNLTLAEYALRLRAQPPEEQL